MNSRRWHIRLGLNYCQLTVCQTGLHSPFNDWTEIHANQGFTWRSGSVSFGTYATDTPEARVRVELRDRFIPQPLAVRVIRVPFAVGATGVELTTPVGESRILSTSPQVIMRSISPLSRSRMSRSRMGLARGGGAQASAWAMTPTNIGQVDQTRYGAIT